MVVDGTNMVHRAYHAMESSNLRDEDGNPTWAVSGIVSMIATFVSAVGPTSLIVAFDSIGGCPSRKVLAPDYKGGRSETPEDLKYQLPRALEVLRLMGVSCLEYPDWESDDILATVAARVSASGSETVVVSSDKDAHQLINSTCQVYKPEGKFVTDVELMAKYGLGGHRWVEYAAMVGEQADNLTGVNGVGPKRAAMIIANFADVEDAIAHPEQVTALINAKVSLGLVTDAGIFRRNRLVGTLRGDLELDLTGVRMSHLDAGHIADVLGDLGLHNAARRFAGALSAF